ncbi:glutathione synthase [Methylomonas sp. MED-D]|uniref:Glutathione synthetase n=1 Tax=Methylomonas koyamae TaxID=702114 RepID=A0A177P9N1_9GAMM|nr:MULTISPECIES: glutathione synthase [Methylomonas]NJA06046.1 glutathione synthase [Methylococcaceae bacterium WWC4]MDT4330671.1 glutathione synthase [Methylomonas sp. MV1]OAI26792.1 glutathione synthase [Methylomonas koyamae]OHX36015.1 glutathione synthase [Methylomonas sp. LWB]WGS86200.1 glutathione synthase [Methylomonas sp. UP202]
MAIKLGMVMDPIDQINIKKDTSFAMLLEAQARGWELHYLELADLYLSNGHAYARSRLLRVERNPNGWFEFTGEQRIELADLDAIIMRKDPPFNQEYIYATYMLEQAERQGVYVVNKPQSLRDANEKMYTAWFPQCCTDTLVARERQRIREFLAEHREIILKPLDGMGGASIFYVREGDPNLSVILETMTDHGSRFIMAQKYLPEVRDGDKRILMVNGEPVPYCLARIPASGESRGNLAAGGRGEGRELSARDRWIAEQVGPVLREKGLIFVGLDVIGDYLTEVNVTSPTCVQELDKQFGINISAQLMDHIAAKVSA